MGVTKPVSSKSFFSMCSNGFVGRNIAKQGCHIDTSMWSASTGMFLISLEDCKISLIV